MRPPNLRHAIYDGDTPRDERSGIRQKTNLFLTNPDMLNLSVLPNHRQWGDVLADITRHLALLYAAEDTDLSEAEIRTDIMEAFIADLGRSARACGGDASHR